jgi:hypothetical protein
MFLQEKHLSSGCKMIKIGKMPRIVPNENRWGGIEPGYYVMSYNGYVTRDIWLKIQAFEGFDMKQKVTKENIADLEFKISVLMTFSHGHQLWQLNMKAKNDDKCEEYIRILAGLGEKSLVKWTFLHDIYTKYLNIKCTIMNLGVKVTQE